MSDGEQQKVKLLFTIIDRKMGEKFIAMYKSEGLIYNLMLMGRGTAKSDLLDLLGLGETEKYVIMSPIRAEKVPHILARVKDEMDIERAGHGIAFTIPIASVGGAKIFEYISGLFRDLIHVRQGSDGEGENHG